MVRKPRVSLSLTPAAVAVLDELTNATELSRSALVEHMLQGRMAFDSPALAWTVRIQDTEAGPTVATVSSGPPPSSPTPAPDPATLESAAVEVADEAPEAPVSTASDTTTPNLDDPGTASSPDHSDGQPLAQAPETSPDRTAEITALQQQLAAIKAQLAAAQTLPPAISPGAKSSASEPINDPVPALQQQLLAAIAAQDDLQAQLQGQAQELATLRQQLAQQQSLAAVGERQLNRWRYHTYAQ